ncbi:STAS domain-containing protein [Mycolicibacterium sp. BiH015]|uniref:STAS domain-containing protein n=1 Tax=Mycolicibacterium sp. BiH015 TaxID=3018808 RepID=UPI0022DFDAE4|nr:STAS domain-containing protein [Mycolicibacterium sp. BiH015]MDA2893978.1 STAS domain-containing protein [Mycolicibacterium sp. BiH015]
MELVEIVQEVRGGAVVVHVSGEVDSGTVDSLSEALTTAIAEAPSHPARCIVIELDGVTYFGSAGLNALLNCSEKARAEGVAVRVVATGAEVLRPIEVTKISAILPPYRSLSEALAVTDETQ